MRYDVILEGPEGSGKTSAAAILVDKFGYAYRHDGPPDPMIDESCILHYYHLLYESFPRPFVWDRSIVGELVYGPIFRNKSRLTMDQVAEFLAIFRAKGGRSVLMVPSMALIKENWELRQEEQRRKAETNHALAGHVKSALLDDFANMERIYDRYWMFAHLFDHVAERYLNIADWVAIMRDGK